MCSSNIHLAKIKTGKIWFVIERSMRKFSIGKISISKLPLFWNIFDSQGDTTVCTGSTKLWPLIAKVLWFFWKFIFVDFQCQCLLKIIETRIRIFSFVCLLVFQKVVWCVSSSYIRLIKSVFDWFGGTAQLLISYNLMRIII